MACFVVPTAAAIVTTAVSKKIPQELHFDWLNSMLWGATIMILVDHILGYTGGAFLEKTTDGMIKNSAALGIVMLVPVLVIWGSSLVISKLKRR